MRSSNSNGSSVMDSRKAVYEEARAINPKRLTQGTRDWDLPEKVWLNPERDCDDAEVAA
jgi:putative transposase